MIKYVLRPAIILLIFVIFENNSFAQKFRTNGNVSFSSTLNWESYIGNEWKQATIIPSCLHDSIFIESNDTAIINSLVALDQLIVKSDAVLINQFQQGDGLDSSFYLFDGIGYDLTIKNGGKYIHEMDQYSALPAGNGTILIEKGGVIQINNNHSGYADYYANNESVEFSKRVIWSDSSFFIWNTTGFISTVDITYFPNVDSVTVPIFVFSGSAVYNGSNSKTVINGILQITENKIMRWKNRGDKIFRNGFINYGTLEQTTDCGYFCLNGNKAVIENHGTIIANETGFILGDGNNRCNVLIDNNIDFNRSNVQLNSNIVLHCDTFSLLNIDTLTINPNTTLEIENLYGFDNCFNYNTIIYDSLIDVIISGNTVMTLGNSFPDKIHSLLVNTQNTVSYTKNIKTDSLILVNGKLFSDDDTVFITNSSESALEQLSRDSYIIGSIQRYVSSSGSYTFPVGDISYCYNSVIDINNSNNLKHITFRFLNNLQDSEVVENFTINGFAVKSLPFDNFWRFAPNADYSDVDYNLTFKIPVDMLQDYISNYKVISIIKKEKISENWGTGSQGITENTFIDGDIFVLKNSNIKAFSEGTAAEVEDVVLPISLLSFYAENKFNTIVLEWTSQIEINGDYFQVLKSYDGINFYCLGNVNTKGNENTITNYLFEDFSPVNGLQYYKLKIYDKDGTYKFSKTISTIYSNNNDVYTFNDNSIKIDPLFYDEYDKTIIYNNQGQIIISDRSYIVDISCLSVGQYIGVVKLINNQNINFRFYK